MWFFISPILPFHPLHRPRNLTAEARIFRSLKIKIKDLRNLTATYHFLWDHVFLKKKSIFESCFRQPVVSRRKRSENQPRRWEWREAILSQPFLLVLCSYCFPLLWSFPLSFFRIMATITTSTHPWRHIGVGFRWVWKDFVFVFVYLQICGVDRGFSKLIYVLGRVLDVSETCKLIYFLSQNLKLNLQFKHFFRTAERSLRI